jgi:hypothetical protein
VLEEVVEVARHPQKGILVGEEVIPSPDMVRVVVDKEKF